MKDDNAHHMTYPLVNVYKKNDGKSPFIMGKSSESISMIHF